MHSDLALSDGTIIYSRYGYGPLLFKLIMSYYYLSAGHMQYIVYRDPAYDILTSWDLNKDYPVAKTVIEDVYDFAPNTEALASYLKSGKKLMVWHGADDTLVSHYETISWCKNWKAPLVGLPTEISNGILFRALGIVREPQESIDSTFYL